MRRAGIRTDEQISDLQYGKQLLEIRLADQIADPARRLVAESEGRLVGVASVVDGPADWEVSLGYVPSPTPRELSRLYVAPEFHGTGLAAELFDRLDDGTDLYLWLIDGNERAHRFYRSRGFVDLAENFQAGDSWGNVGMHRMARLANG